MKLPSKNVGGWAAEVIQQCSSSQKDRIQRGALYRNLYLTGSETGDTAVYNKTFAYMDNLSAYLYSPVELRFGIEKYGSSTPADRAKSQAASSELHRHIRQGEVDTQIEETVIWSLVKGKTFIKLLWGEDGFEPAVVQPEMMGVLREDLPTLDEQEAFFHSVFLTPDRFAQMIENHADRDALLKKAANHIHPANDQNNPDSAQALKQVIIGGMNPYRQAGGGRTQSRGIVDWLGGPAPTLAPDVLASILRIDELWVWDDDRDDYTTIQIIGDDCVIEGLNRHRNLIADMFDPDNTTKSIPANEDNPLSGHQPFIEICPNKLAGYFWGRSELCNIALLQQMINKRVDGINHLLRRQEDPAIKWLGGQAPTQQQYSKLRKPGALLADSNPNAKIDILAPDLPQGLWDSLHEMEGMYDKMAGFTPTLQGRGEAGVRAGGHSDSLAKNASPRFKDRALAVERSVESIGGLALDYLKAKDATKLTAWVMPKDDSIDASVQYDPDVLEPPVKGMKPIEFLFNQLPRNCKVIVDSHSSSPAFSHETKALLFDLFKAGAIDKKQLVQHTAPPGEDTMLEDLVRAEVSQAAFAEAHPEEVLEAQSKGKKKK